MSAPAQPIAAQRCFNHAGREAAARCPVCRRFFCRECVTEHDQRVLCTGCLRQQTRRGGATRRWSLAAVSAAAGLAAAWLVFWLLGRVLLTLPSEFHEGTIWMQ